MDGTKASEWAKTEPRRRGKNSGLHYSFFGGRIVLGPDWKSIFGSMALILAPSALFFAKLAAPLGRDFSWAVVAIAGVLLLLSLAFLFTTAFMDPGFIPRVDEADIETGPRPETQEYEVNGFVVSTKWCITCHHYRPPRCSHCAVCDNCVRKFDHHCPWVGNCIGERNYRFFLCFVMSTTVLDLYVHAWSWARLGYISTHEHVSFGHAIREEPAAMALIGYTFLAFIFVGGLSSLHTYFASNNRTTYEHFRSRHNQTGNPYDLGCNANWRQVCCTPMAPRYPENRRIVREPIELQPMDNRRREDGHYISSQAQPQSPAQPITVGAEGKPMQELPNGLATHMIAGSSRAAAPAAEAEYYDGDEHVEKIPHPLDPKGVPRGARRFSEKYSDDDSSSKKTSPERDPVRSVGKPGRLPVRATKFVPRYGSPQRDASPDRSGSPTRHVRASHDYSAGFAAAAAEQGPACTRAEANGSSPSAPSTPPLESKHGGPESHAVDVTPSTAGTPGDRLAERAAASGARSGNSRKQRSSTPQRASAAALREASGSPKRASAPGDAARRSTRESSLRNVTYSQADPPLQPAGDDSDLRAAAERRRTESDASSIETGPGLARRVSGDAGPRVHRIRMSMERSPHSSGGSSRVSESALGRMDSRSGCLPSAPRPTVSGTVSESLVGVMSGAKEGSLDHQVVGEPETIEGGTNLQRQASRPPNQRRSISESGGGEPSSPAQSHGEPAKRWWRI